MNHIARLWSLLSLATLLLFGCQKETSDLDAQYGYVQFKLVKEASMESSATRATDILERLADAYKIKVVMQSSGSTITQTLPLSAYDEESAEWGVMSDKLQLLVGKYNIIGYYIYDIMDAELYVGEGAGEFQVVQGGLNVKSIGVECVERGKISFRLSKQLTTRADFEGNYLFERIKAVDITVQNNFSKETTTFKALKTTLVEEYDTTSDKATLGTYMECAGSHWLKAGRYTITSYTTYSDTKAKNRLESATINDLAAEFSVVDNQLNVVAEVPILLSATAEHIKDYEALKEIWLALDGPNWSFHGEEYASGTNWNFDKDIDMWGDQPGVTLNSEGRVENLNLSGFGAKGIVPDAIGQLTDLKLLYLGNHNELIGGYDASTSSRIEAMDYYTTALKRDGREGLSAELKQAINSDPNQRPILASRIELKDVAFGNFTNGIKGISRAVMRLTKLEQLFIANSPIKAEEFFVEVAESSPYYQERNEWSWANFTNLMDVEIYNCPNLDRLPRELITELPNMQSLNVAVNYGISAEQLKADWEALIDGASGEDIQILYIGFNNLEETPSTDYLRRMKKIGLLDCNSNRLRLAHPFGKEVAPTTILFDYNRIEELHPAEDGYFCGVSQLEEFSCSNNALTELPDIFSATSVYSMLTVNFSSNNISALANGVAWRGVNTSTLNLADNAFEELPKRLMGSGSRIGTLMLSSNGMRRIEEGALIGAGSENLTTIDLSFNRLTALPYDDFSISTIPYLYGIDLSSNAFSEFPYAPLSVDRLTVMSIRQQRDDQGNRTLKEWPTGLHTHKGMTAFYIGSNDLRKIEDTISPYILLFEIKDNPNISIDLSNVCPYIEMGYYELIYDSTQDIRGCDALNLD